MGADEPCFTAPTVLRGTLTPSFMGIPWPRLLALREWFALVGGVALPGAGDCERGVGAAEVLGGPFAQADFVGNWEEIFCVETVEDLLILNPPPPHTHTQIRLVKYEQVPPIDLRLTNCDKTKKLN